MNKPKLFFLSLVSVLLVTTAGLIVMDNSDGNLSDVREVTTWQEFSDALGDAGVSEIRMKDDIGIENPVTLGRSVTIDGGMHSLMWGESDSGNIVTITSGGCVLKNLAVDCVDKMDGILVSKADNVVFENVKITSSMPTSCALTVDMSNVVIKPPFIMENNGEIGDGDYIHLAWSGTENDTDMCSVTFDSLYTVESYDRINVSIQKDDLSKAGVTVQTWEQKFSVKHGESNLCHSVYGTDGDHCILFNNGIAKVGNTRYASVAEAAAIAQSSEKTLELTQDCTGEAFVLPDGHSDFNMDLKGYIYRIYFPPGVPYDNMDRYLNFGIGGKVTISNGEISSAMPSTSVIIDTKCDMELKSLTMDISDIAPSFGPHSQDYSYAISVSGGTTTLIDVKVWRIIEEKSHSDHHSLNIYGEGAKVITRGRCVLMGDVDIEGKDSVLDVFGLFAIANGERGRDDDLVITDGKVHLNPGCSFESEVHSAGDDDYVLFNNVSTSNGAEITGSPLTIKGDLVADGNRGSLMFCGSDTNSVGVVVDFTTGPNIGLSIGCKVIIDGSLIMMSGSEMTMATGGKFVSSGTNAHIILMDGCTYDGTMVTGDHVIKVDSGGSLEEQIVAVFVANEHVKGFTYDGKEMDFIEFPKSQSSFVLDFSLLSANVDDGYAIAGWEIDGQFYGTHGTVKITENTFVTPVLKKIAYDSDSSPLTVGLIFFVAIIGLLIVASGVMSKK